MKAKTKTERVTIRITKEKKRELSNNAKFMGFTKTHNGKEVPNIADYIRVKLGL